MWPLKKVSFGKQVKNVYKIREYPEEKKCSFNLVIFHKGGEGGGGGGGSEPIQKFWSTFLCPNNFGILSRKWGVG